MTINDIQQEIIDEFSVYDEWMDKYALIINYGNELEPMDEKYKVPENLIEGCQSRVWLRCYEKDGLLYFEADCDAVIVKGLLALILRIFSGQKAEDIINCDLHFLKDIGLTDHLSPTRSNGLLAVIKQIQYYAMAHKLKQLRNSEDEGKA